MTRQRQVDQEHLLRLCRSGKAFVVPVSTMQGFPDFLESLPWSPGGGLDWRRIDGSELVLSDLDERRLRAWPASTALADDTHVVFWLGDDEPCIACAREFGLAHFDEVLWRLPGRRYFCGATMRDGALVPHFGHFVEYDGADQLAAAR